MARTIRCGLNIDPKNPKGRPSVDDLADLGVDWVRFTFKDDRASEPPGEFPFYDRVVQDLYQAGIRILMILSYETLPGRPGLDADDAAWDAFIKRFAARCQHIAQNYKNQVQAYQIWNEPDHPPKPGYDPTLRPQVFGRMLKACYEAIKATSTATVVAGGLAAGQPGWLDDVRKATPDRRIYADAIGVHPYGRRPEPAWPEATWGFGTLDRLLLDYHTAARLPLWITEFGTEYGGFQPEFPERSFLCMDRALADKAPCAFWFCWSDGMVPGFGLLDDMNGKKPSYRSFQTFARQPLMHGQDREGRFEDASLREILGMAQEGLELRSKLFAAAADQERIRLNPNAALQSRMLADGYMPTTNEFDLTFEDVPYRAQRGDNPHTQQARVYYAKVPDWGNVGWRGWQAFGLAADIGDELAFGHVDAFEAAGVGGVAVTISDWARRFRVAIKGIEDRPDSPAGDVVYVVKDIFTTRDGSWEPSEHPGSVPAWARERYLKPFGAKDYFDDAGGDHHLFSLVLGLDGKPMPRKGIMYWSDGFDKLGDHLYRSFTVVETKEHSGWGNIPIFSGYDPEQGGGPWCWCPIGPAEVVTGGGMPGNWHVSTFVVWQAVKRDGTDAGASDAVRRAAWYKLGAGYVADSAFVRYARQHGLGIPVTEEFDHAGLRVQGFVSGIVMAPAGRWDQISHLPW